MLDNLEKKSDFALKWKWMGLLAPAILLALSQSAEAGSCAPDFQKEDILYIGDSISVSSYSDAIAKAIKAGDRDLSVARYAVAGSAAIHWRGGFNAPFFRHRNTLCETRSGRSHLEKSGQEVPDFPRLMDRATPQAVVIALGTNDINNYCTDVSRGGRAGLANMWMKGVRDLVSAIPSRTPCTWISPLSYEQGTIAKACSALPDGVRGALAVLREAIGVRCRFIDSSQVCPLNLQFDQVGIHPIGRSSQILGDCVGREVRRSLPPIPQLDAALSGWGSWGGANRSDCAP